MFEAVQILVSISVASSQVRFKFASIYIIPFVFECNLFVSIIIGRMAQMYMPPLHGT